MNGPEMLSAAEIERLAVLAEECAEVQHAVSKILRHGFESWHPETGEMNRAALAREIGDLHVVLETLFEAGDIARPSEAMLSDARARKARYSHYNAA